MECSRNALLAYDIHHCPPARVHVPIAGSADDLLQLATQLLFVHPLPIVSLAKSEQLLATCTRALESLDHTLSPDRVITGQHGFSVLKTSYYRLDNPTSESRYKDNYLFSKRE